MTGADGTDQDHRHIEPVRLGYGVYHEVLQKRYRSELRRTAAHDHDKSWEFRFGVSIPDYLLRNRLRAGSIGTAAYDYNERPVWPGQYRNNHQQKAVCDIRHIPANVAAGRIEGYARLPEGLHH